MSRRVVLVDLPWSRLKDPPVSLAHASLLAALRAHTSADVRSVVGPINHAPAAHAIVEQILDEAGDVDPHAVDVAIGVYVWSDGMAREVTALLRRRRFVGRILLGGPQITYAGPEVERLYPGATCFVRGYGEMALCDLVERDDSAVACPRARPLPSPWLDGTSPLRPDAFVRWETQRGCPYACSFCQHRHPGKRARRYDLERERVLAEVDLFCAAGIEDISVVDPIFHAGAHANAVLQRFVTNGYRGRLSLQCRAETIVDGFLDAAAELRQVRLEFGLQTIHPNESRAVRRANDIGKIDTTLAAVRKRGLPHEVSLIYGLPEQTLASFVCSVGWCLERRVPAIKAFPLMLLRGTTLHAERHRWGLVESDSPIPTVIGSSTFNRHDVSAMARIARALEQTEGRHPDLEALLELAEANADADSSPERAGKEAA